MQAQAEIQRQKVWDLKNFDYTAYRAEFVRLKALGDFQRVMRKAEAVKAQKWDNYKQEYERFYGRPYVHAN